MSGIALFGGTFDPIHIGHLRGLIEAREILGFKKLFIIPAGVPPHKIDRMRSSPGDRLEMARIASEETKVGEVSSYELESDGPSYTLNTLLHFFEGYGESSITMIIGSDSLIEISSWHGYQEILDMTNIAVIPRPGFLTDVNPEEVEKHISPVKIEDFKRDYPVSGSDSIITDRGKRISILKINRLNLSSSDIRERVKNGRSIKFLVTGMVEKYIIEKRLYMEVQ